MVIEDVHRMADEAAALMAARLGGVRRGRTADLATMIRRRGGALPRRQRRAARVLAQADLHTGSPRIARQMDMRPVMAAHRELIDYLGPLNARERWAQRGTNIAATVVFGLLVLGIAVIWVMVRRGQL